MPGLGYDRDHMSDQRRLRSPLHRLRTPRRFRNLSFAALLGLWIIVPSGALVRLTDSGLGCPDWPLCDGSVVPETASHAIIEFTNRALSAVVMAVCVLTWLVVRRLPGRTTSLVVPSAIIAVTTAGQVPLGAVTVLSGLHPLAVSSHFLLSMVALAAGSILAVNAHQHAAGRTQRWDLRRGGLALATAVAAGATIVTGVLVTAAGPHAGDPGAIERLGDVNDAAYVHVRAAAVFIVLATILVAWLIREGAPRETLVLSLVTLPLLAIQMGIGEYQFRNGLPWEVVQFHVSFAALIWAAIVATTWSVARPALDAPAAARPAEPAAGADPVRAAATS